MGSPTISTDVQSFTVQANGKGSAKEVLGNLEAVFDDVAGTVVIMLSAFNDENTSFGRCEVSEEKLEVFCTTALAAIKKRRKQRIKK